MSCTIKLPRLFVNPQPWLYLESMDTLRDRLIHARQRLGLTQEQVAKRADMSQAAYQKLEAGISKRSRFLPEVARVLEVSPLWLTDGVDRQYIKGGTLVQLEQNVQDAEPRLQGMAPEISWVAAGQWSECTAGEIDEGTAWHPRPAGASPDTFVLRVIGDSMAPEYEAGRLIFVDPQRAPISGDDVIAVLTESNSATFKRFIEEPGGQRLLKALNPDWRDPYMPINGNCHVIGVVVADMRIR